MRIPVFIAITLVAILIVLFQSGVFRVQIGERAQGGYDGASSTSAETLRRAQADAIKAADEAQRALENGGRP